MKRSNEIRKCKRLHRVFLGSVFLFCLNLIGVKWYIDTGIVESLSWGNIVQVTQAQSNTRKNIKNCEKDMLDNEKKLKKGKIKCLISTRIFNKPIPFRSPFTEYKNNLGKDKKADKKELINLDDVKNQNNKKMEVNNKNIKITVRPEVKGVILGEKPKVVFGYKDEIIFIGVGEYYDGKQILTITKNKVVSDKGIIWERV